MYTRDNNICEEFENIIKDLTSNPTVQKMNEFKQHYSTSCYDHCLNVAFYSYMIAKKLGLNYKAVARGAMLHDLFLYDWRNSKKAFKIKEISCFYTSRNCIRELFKIILFNRERKGYNFKTYVAGNNKTSKISRKLYCYFHR